jgi:hypothetical protein
MVGILYRLQVLLITCAFYLPLVSHADELRFPTIGVIFDVPKGMVPDLNAGPSVLGLLTPSGEVLSTSKYFIALEFAQSKKRLIKDYASSVASRLDGEVTEITLGGEKAYQIRARDNSPKRTPRLFRLVEKEEYFFLFLLHTSSKNEGQTEFDSLCNSLRWTVREQPSENLKLVSKKVLFDGAISLHLPRILRSHPTSPNEAAFGAFNYIDNHEEFFLQGRMLNTEGEKDLMQVATDFGKLVSPQLSITKDLEWTKSKMGTLVLRSKRVSATLKPPGGPTMIHKISYVLARAPSGRTMLLQFGIANASESAIGRYDQCIDEICESIEFGKQ